MRVLIGKVCQKGPHASFIGEPDYGACGSHEFASIYVTVEEDFPNSRGEEYTAEQAAEGLRLVVAAAEAHGWCDTEAGA